MHKKYKRNELCRACKKHSFTKILDFGVSPPANAFLTKVQLSRKESFFPLRVYICNSCHLVQLKDVVSPKLLFKKYVYVSSTSEVFINHFKKLAHQLTKKFKLNKKSLVIDIGSNDGIFLKPFMTKKIKVLGIEPAINIANMANGAGIETISRFFSLSLAKQIRKKYGPASIITATNVFAHINDLDEVIEGVRIMLSPMGVFIIEAPYLIDFLRKNLFDTVYHEHLSYFSVFPLKILFERFKMKIFHVEKTYTHGGSLRIFATVSSHIKRSSSVYKYLALEKKYKLNSLHTYKKFANRVEKNKQKLLTLLQTLKSQNKTIIGFGAPAKGNTLLNYFGITNKTLKYIVDDNHLKQGLYTPGTHIPIHSIQKLYEDKPDYILLLAWNFADSIMKKLQKYRNAGGKFIIPVPTPEIS